MKTNFMSRGLRARSFTGGSTLINQKWPTRLVIVRHGESGRNVAKEMAPTMLSAESPDTLWLVP